MTMKASLKGKYKGRETIHTPAGDFDCIKIYTEQKGKCHVHFRNRIFNRLVCQKYWAGKIRNYH